MTIAQVFFNKIIANILLVSHQIRYNQNISNHEIEIFQKALFL